MAQRQCHQRFIQLHCVPFESCFNRCRIHIKFFNELLPSISPPLTFPLVDKMPQFCTQFCTGCLFGCTEHETYRVRLFGTDQDARLLKLFALLHYTNNLGKFCMIHNLEDALCTAALDPRPSAKTWIIRFFASGFATTIQKFVEDKWTHSASLLGDPVPGVSTPISRKFCSNGHWIEISFLCIDCSLQPHRYNGLNAR